MTFNHIYLVRCSETTPLDGEGVRLLRTGQMYAVYSQRYPCTWLVSTFDHYGRAQRFRRTTLRVVENGTIVFIRTPGYQSNVSFRRLYDHFVFGVKSALWLSRRVTSKDVLILAMPTIFACFLGVLVAKIKGAVPVVEIRDKWPDIFWYGLSGLRQRFVRVACAPLDAMLMFALRNALVVTVPSREYGEWATSRFGVKKTSVLVSPLGYRSTGNVARNGEVQAIARRIAERAMGKRIVCFFGTVGRMFDFETVLKYALAQEVDGDPAQQFYFVFLGGGDLLDMWRRQTADSPFVEFAGWVSKHVLDAVAELSTVALAPYRNTPNFEGHIPNKIMEYLYYGLPVVSCLKGDVQEIILHNRLGACYTEGDPISFGTALRQAASLDAAAPQRAKAYFRANFDADVIYQRLLDEIELRQAEEA